MNNAVAILVFSRTSLAEAKHKRLLPRGGKLQEGKLAALMVNNVLAQTRLAGAPVYQVNQHQQTGSTFGERIANALATVFARGYESIVVVGNDCPQLNTSILHRSLHLLTTADVVFGPDKRGGAYLIGVHRRSFNHHAFQLLPWQSGELAASLQNYAAAAGYSTSILPALADVNNYTDLISLKKLLPRVAKLVQFVINLLQEQVHHTGYVLHTSFSWCCRSQSLRAPPVLG